MARMFLVKDGPPPDNLGPAKQIKLSELYEYKPDLEAEWLDIEPPVFHRESPSMYPQHVVIQVEASEVDDKGIQKGRLLSFGGHIPGRSRISSQILLAFRKIHCNNSQKTGASNGSC